MKKILVTGSSGFIGSQLIIKCLELNYAVNGTIREFANTTISKNFKPIIIKDIGAKQNLSHLFEGVECIIHCAGVAHAMKKKKSYSVDILGTKNLAKQAVKAGVKRFIFLSSIKVNGESTDKNNNIEIFKHDDEPNPQNGYGISKLEAENFLLDIALKTGFEVVIIRLPLVYGKSVKGNLERLIKLIKLRFPLPFEGLNNKRSLIGIDNVVDLIIRCIQHPNAAGNIFLASDGRDLSTSELIKLIASAMGQSVKLFSFPVSLLKFFGFIFGKQDEIDRLTGSLQIDISHTHEILNWKPLVSVEEGIRRMVQGK